MSNPNLILRFRIHPDPGPRLTAASHIRLDGDTLTLIDPETGAAQVLPLASLRDLTIHSVASLTSRLAA